MIRLAWVCVILLIFAAAIIGSLLDATVVVARDMRASVYIHSGRAAMDSYVRYNGWPSWPGRRCR